MLGIANHLLIHVHQICDAVLLVFIIVRSIVSSNCTNSLVFICILLLVKLCGNYFGDQINTLSFRPDPVNFIYLILLLFWSLNLSEFPGRWEFWNWGTRKLKNWRNRCGSAMTLLLTLASLFINERFAVIFVRMDQVFLANWWISDSTCS